MSSEIISILKSKSPILFKLFFFVLFELTARVSIAILNLIF